jgi:hypothetical protein
LEASANLFRNADRPTGTVDEDDSQSATEQLLVTRIHRGVLEQNAGAGHLGRLNGDSHGIAVPAWRHELHRNTLHDRRRSDLSKHFVRTTHRFEQVDPGALQEDQPVGMPNHAHVIQIVQVDAVGKLVLHDVSLNGSVEKDEQNTEASSI